MCRKRGFKEKPYYDIFELVVYHSYLNIFLIPVEFILWTFLTEIYKTKNKNVTIKLSVYILNNLIFFYFMWHTNNIKPKKDIFYYTIY